MSYTPTPPTTVSDLPRFLTAELQSIAEATLNVDCAVARFKVWNVEPDKPRQGEVYFADGTNWNPGSGEGLYVRLSGGWSKL